MAIARAFVILVTSYADVTMIQPFNAFLSGFSATVGQFVLTASLRMQTNPENKPVPGPVFEDPSTSGTGVATAVEAKNTADTATVSEA